MKRLSKLLLLLFTLFLVPPIVLADTNIDINKPVDYNQNNIVIKNIKFNDLSKTTTGNFGLTGDITNNNDYDVFLKEVVNYYNQKEELIASGNTVQIINAKDTIKYIAMSDLNKLIGTNSTSDIKYYSIVIEATKYVKDTTTIVNKDEYAKYDYVVDDYNISVNVNENNSFDITEMIDAYFNKEKHGIYRSLPLHNSVYHQYYKTFYNNAMVSNISCNTQFSKYLDSDNLVLQIGDPNTTITGYYKYVLSYNYKLNKDETNAYDELYYNLVGTDFTSPMANVSFKVTMPKGFDPAKISFTSGTKGSTGNKVIYSVKDNVITGFYNGILNPGEAITIRLVLDNNYFTKAGINISLYKIITLIILFAITLICYLIWYFRGKDAMVVTTPEFYAPDNLNSLEVAYVCKNKKIKSKDISSLLIYLASKGYLKISENDTGYKITRLKQYDSNNSYESDFYCGLFGNGEFNPNENNYVTNSDLKSDFSYTLARIKDSIIKNGCGESKVFDSKAPIYQIIICILIILFAIVAIVGPVLEFYTFPLYGFQKSFIALFLASFVIFYIFLSFRSGWIYGIIPSIIGIPFVFVMLPEILNLTSIFNAYDIIIMLTGSTLLVINIVLASLMPKRTPYGSKLYGRILGFKNFLITADKDQLEAQVQQNPTYFYDILPYTYVLGISEKWISKFDDIGLPKPAWYEGTADFNFGNFNYFIDDTLSTSTFSAPIRSGAVNTALDIVKDVIDFSIGGSGFGGGDSGGSSGGGSSGGGSGGGGMGSW